MIKYTLLFLLFTLFSCSDFQKKGQLEKIQRSQRNLYDIEKELKVNKIDTMSKIKLATNEVELRIKNNLVLDTINLILGKKMDDYKRMRKSFEPLGRSYSQLMTGISEERMTLNNLVTDIQNGEGERNKYDTYIVYENNKIKQLKILLNSYISFKNKTMETFFRLHNELDSLSRALIKP
jgi:hypothetical protein